MPPKKNQLDAKAKANKRAQAASDKTFGLKNKNKSAKVQSYVKQVEAQTANADIKKKEAENARRQAEKKAAEQARLESQALFKPVLQQQKVPFGVDPKSVLCVFYKQGVCTKGNKCKFSHNLDVERKAEKRDLYSDERTSKENDTMDNWDEEKLRNVVMSKHGNPKTTTDIVCKYFIEAVENGKYGWFWICPNGGDECKYKHSLPPGFKLKTKEQLRLEKEAAANNVEISLEDFIETERDKLPKQLTPVTLDTFTKWKKDRMEKKLAEQEIEQKKQKTAITLSGKQLLDSGKFVEEYEEEEDGDNGNVWDLSDLRRRIDSDEERDNDENEQEQHQDQDQDLQEYNS